MKPNKLFPGYMILIMSMIAVLLFTGCGKTENSENEKNPDAKSPVVTKTTPKPQDDLKDSSQRDPNYLTSMEAVQLAYEEAKVWSNDAVLKSMTTGTDLGLHYAWTETDMSYSWSVNFVSPEKKQYLIVYVNYGKVLDTHISDDSLKNMPLEGHPEDRPLITLKEAYSAALDGGAISGLVPVNVDYNTYGYSDMNFPYWVIIYKVPVTAKTKEMHYYYINAETGKFANAIYKNDDNDIISVEELQVKGKDLSELAPMEDQRHMVIKFLTLINEGKTQDAVDMMDESMRPNQNMKDMWIQSLSSIQGHEFIQGGFTNEDEDSWTDDTQRFKVKINIPETCECEGFGWDHGQNTRWIKVVKGESGWMIHEVSTSP